MKIDTVEKLKAHLKIMKMKLSKAGYEKLQLYPAFCVYYDKFKERYELPKEQVFNLACEILIEED